MAPDLSGPLQKLERAKFHLGLIDAQLDAPPGEGLYTVTIEPDAVSGQYLLQLHKRPDTLVECIGDFLYNLRATLDYLAHQLAGAPDVEYSDIAFPLRKTGKAFDDAARKQLAGVDPNAIAAIRLLQPFPPGFKGDPDDHALWVLNELENVDKHRLLHTVAFTANEFTVTIDAESDGQIAWLEVPRPLNDTTTLAVIAIDPEPKVGRETHLAFDVALEKTPRTPQLGLTVLDGMLASVENAVAVLRPYFRP